MTTLPVKPVADTPATVAGSAPTDLVLFDIDATLVTTSGVGIHAMRDAGLELFGTFDADRIEYAGRLDPLIIRDLLASNGHAPTPERARAFADGYTRHLARLLQTCPVKRALPGVHDLTAALLEVRHFALGLLTGNFEHTGCLKLRACGVNPDHYPIRAWGDESPHDPPSRDHLPPIAMNRFAARYARPIRGERVTIIGDTPHDIRCAKASGCRVIAVATGRHALDELRSHSPDLAVKDLSDTRMLVSWIVGDARV